MLMYRKSKRNLLAPALAALLWGCFAVACSPQEGGRETSAATTVYVRASQEEVTGPSSRTFIGGAELDRCFWSEEDRIGVYSRPAGSVDQPTGRTFGCYMPYPDQALFTAEITPMEEGEYIYYGAYPLPEGVDGTRVTWRLPSEQSGRYRGYRDNFDFMLASPVRGEALTAGGEALSMNFIHQCHIMRIQIPKGRNLWGAEIGKLRVEFPSDVVGLMTLDMADPTGTPVLSEGGASVVARLRAPLHESEEDSPEGEYVWLFLCPGRISGTVRFTAYDTNGYQSASLEVEMDKVLEAGRITPVTLTVPQELPVTWMELAITGNHLGEEPRMLTVKAPQGARFRNGTDTCSFRTDGAERYRVWYYDRYDGIDNGALLRDGEFTFTYESDRAIVSESRTVAPFPEKGGTPFGLTVPYLFQEDFGRAGGTDQNDSTVALDAYNLPGWSGSRFGLGAGTAAMISAYLSSSAIKPDPDEGNNKRGRMDTPPLSAIKEGATVTLDVSFDIGGTSQKGTNFLGQAVVYSQYEFGTDTRQGPVDYTTGIENVVVALEDAGTGGSYTALPLHREGIEVPGCTGAHRLSWRTSYRIEYAGASTITGKTVYVYLDNIKVSIKD